MIELKLRGKVWKFGDDINTDLIYPGKYMELVDPEEMAAHAMEGFEQNFSDKVMKGDLLVGGANFGCGSSREHAPIALKHAGISAILAESFARIFFRNSINIGMPAIECRGISKTVKEGDLLEIDVTGGTIKNLETGIQLKFEPIPEFMIMVLDEGGLVPYMRKNIEEW